MPTSTRRSPARSSASSATPGRPASRRTGCSCRRASTTTSSSRFTEAVRGLKVADGFAEGVNVGPLIDEPAVEKVERHVADAAARGAEVVVGGERIEGQFFQPSVLVGVPADAGDELRGDVRAGRRDRTLLDRGRGDPRRERHAVRPLRVLLLAGSRARHARGRGARVRDRRHQHRAHLDGSGAVRRRRRSRGWAARARRTGSTSGSSSSTGRSAASEVRE